MKRWLLGAILCALSGCIPTGAYSETKSPDTPALINGRPAPVGQFPATAFCSMNGAGCTCDVIGPQAVLIAAHCVANGATASFSVGANRYSSVCQRSPGYARDATDDFALCKTDRIVTGVPYENVKTDYQCQPGAELLLSGYGCTRRGGSVDGVFRIGEALIQSCPTANDNDIVTRPGGAVLCPGDSGGAVWAYLDREKTYRAIVAVNSRTDWTRSYIPALNSSDFRSFVTQWVMSKNVQICGVSPGVQGCRQGVDPEPDPDAPRCEGEARLYATAKETADEKWTLLAACLGVDN